MPDSDTPHTRHASPGTIPGVSGRLILLWTLIGCVVLFFIVWGTLRLVEHHIRGSRPELIWADRTTWHAPTVIQTTLVRPNPANAQYTYNKPRYRDPGFEVASGDESMVLGAADLARSDDFRSLPTLAGIVLHAHQPPDFYTDYLIATWHRLQGRRALADDYYQWSIELAPKILVIHYADTDGQPVARLKLDRVEIGCDRVTDEGQTLDQRLVLVYPHLETDAAGRVYLPVYDTTYRPVYLPQPDGYEVTYSPNEGWFKSASRLGAVHAKVTRRPD